MIQSTEPLRAAVVRLPFVLQPNDDPCEAYGVLNPACTRTRDGKLMLFPRDVQTGNISRIGRVRMTVNGDEISGTRDGYALEPQAPYELRERPGYGCEDSRVTYIAAIDRYVMTYTAYGPEGPRVAVALSQDAVAWTRLGLMRFGKPGMLIGDDKDAAFFPEPVLSPKGVESLAFYHRPMLHLSAVDGRAAIPMIQRLPFADRESIRIGYVPLAAAVKDVTKLLDVGESLLVMSPDANWGSIKIGAGTPPVRIAEGWMSLFHGVDVVDDGSAAPKFRYSAGIVVHDLREPHKIVYRSPEPVLIPESDDELRGIVDNVVFPTGIDPRVDLGARTFDVYYGMADYSIGAARLTLA
ncbi:MAG TPA: hypothetical protein VIJ12_10750 [Candidatus Baltobacteraceae bacterium]